MYISVQKQKVKYKTLEVISSCKLKLCSVDQVAEMFLC